MKTLRLTTLAATVLMTCSSLAFADSTTIATVNIQQIFSDSTAAKSVREQLEVKQKAFQAELSKKEDAMQKEGQELNKEHSALSKSAYDAKDAAFRKKVADAQKEMQTKKALLDNASSRAGAEIQKAVSDVVNDIAKDKGISAVIPSSELLFADPKLDISAEVLKRLNDKLPKLDVKFDSADAPAAK